MKKSNTITKLFQKNWIFLIPLLIFTIGILYARNIEAFAGIGVVIITILITFASIVGTIYYRITQKILFSVLLTIATFMLILGVLILLIRVGLIS